ncbi:MAG: 30S ribosomal protein S17 [Lentisphaerae bacterium]|nr:30S ribosomal protein S17 [Lentisphaerota bacterium]
MVETKAGKRGVRKQRKGTVVSVSGAKSVVVRVDSRKKHPVYGKIIKQSKKFYVHDEKSEAKVGDGVLIVECRPMSRLKRWRLLEVTRGGKE